MGFGKDWPARVWSDEEAKEWMYSRDVVRCWEKRGMGDFAVGLRSTGDRSVGKELGSGVRILKGDEYELFIGALEGGLEGVEWIGYAGIRDATTTSMPDRTTEDRTLPHWLEMVELRYGISSRYWGRGLARRGAEVAMLWGIRERGVRRYIAETEKENVRSGRVLEKLGFQGLEGTEYWKEEMEREWGLRAEDFVCTMV